jgi:hypothetical protein
MTAASGGARGRTVWYIGAMILKGLAILAVLLAIPTAPLAAAAQASDHAGAHPQIAQAVMFGFQIGEVSCPTKYFKDASSINFKRSVQYGLEVLATTAGFVAHKLGITHAPRYGATGRKVTQQYYTRVAQGS